LRLSVGGRATAERSYNWRVIGDTLIAAYQDLIARAPGLAAAST